MKRSTNKTGAQLSLEALEDRQLLSTSAVILFRTLYITGDAANDSVRAEGFFNSLDIVNNRGERTSFAHSRFDRMVVNLGEGSDTFRLVNNHSHSWGPDDRNLNMHIDLGGGDDVALFFTGADTLSLQGINLDIDLRTGAGVDQVFAHLPGMYDANVDMDIDLGTEGDFLHSFLSGRLFENSHAVLNARGGLGADEMSFEGGPSTYFAPPNSSAIDASSALTVKLFGQRQADKIDMRLEPTLGARFDGRVELYNHGGEGRDILTTNVSRNVNSKGDMYVNVVGAKGNDRLTLNLEHSTFGTPMSFAAAKIGPVLINPDLVFEIVPTIAAKIDGSVGFDFYAATPNVSVVNCEGVIGGPLDIFLPPGDDIVIAR